MDDLKEIAAPAASKIMLTAAQVQGGPPLDPLARILTYSPGEWETFVEEWVFHCLKAQYSHVRRPAGGNDRGIDVAGFADDKFLLGVWDNYQCKHYDQPIAPNAAWREIGKILWHSFNGHYRPPRAYYFVAPKGTGTTLTQLLANAPMLKKELLKAWEKSVKDALTSTQSVPLEGMFAAYVDAFDFSIFKSVIVREMVEQHRQSPCFIERFGGGLPPRPKHEGAPDEIAAHESVYVGRMLDAYAEHTREASLDLAALKKWGTLDKHFQRQREAFYQAEALRIFVRDKVEPGTFESLQDEIYEAVVDVCDKDHPDGYQRVVAVTETAQNVPLDAHPLSPCTFPKDRRGVCHQLANEDRLKWTK